MERMADAGHKAARVWDGPLRVWHWVFAVCIGGSLYTGLAGDIDLVEWHQRLGFTVLGLLLFRLGWSLWGGLHARWSTFRVTPARIVAFLRGVPVAGPRTAPSAALALSLFAVAAVQAVAGLFTSDFIFTEGPLVRYVSDATVDLMSAVHHRAFWAVLALIGVHLTAHGVYGLRRDPVPLSMITGRKSAAVADTPHYWLRAMLTAGATLALVWFALGLV
jgi:cytochrome b